MGFLKLAGLDAVKKVVEAHETADGTVDLNAAIADLLAMVAAQK